MKLNRPNENNFHNAYKNIKATKKNFCVHK